MQTGSNCSQWHCCGVLLRVQQHGVRSFLFLIPVLCSGLLSRSAQVTMATVARASVAPGDNVGTMAWRAVWRLGGAFLEVAGTHGRQLGAALTQRNVRLCQEGVWGTGRDWNNGAGDTGAPEPLQLVFTFTPGELRSAASLLAHAPVLLDLAAHRHARPLFFFSSFMHFEHFHLVQPVLLHDFQAVLQEVVTEA